MKKFFTLFSVLLSFGLCANVNALSLQFLPSDQTVNLGDSALVDILISDLDAMQALGDFDFDLSFDSSILSVNNVMFGSELGFSLQDSSVSGNTVNINELSLESPDFLVDNQPSQFVLASVEFDTLSVGTSILDFANIFAFGDQFGNSLSFDSIFSGSITVLDSDMAPVPVPASLPLFLSAMAGFAAYRRKQKKAK